MTKLGNINRNGGKAIFDRCKHMNKPYIIAELGVNFYDTAKNENITPMGAAKLYIDKAAEAGIDAVKFQSYKAETIASKNSPSYWDLTKEKTTSQFELFKKFDGFNATEYRELSDYCKEKEIAFMSTPFDYQSADYLYDLVDIYKISSSDMNNRPFVEYIAQKGKPVYISVGASYLSEVEETVRLIQGTGCQQLCIMHCVLSYPCKNEDANLSVIQTLKQVFPDIMIGYSDHTMPDDNMAILSTAYMLGAEVIEKHFTLDKTIPGNDHYHAGNPDDFKKAISNFRIIDEVLGNPKKTVLDCEQIPRREARRSLVAARNLKKGEIIKKEDIVAKRPGSGIEPGYADLVIGRECRREIEEDTILQWDMF